MFLGFSVGYSRLYSYRISPISLQCNCRVYKPPAVGQTLGCGFPRAQTTLPTSAESSVHPEEVSLSIDSSSQDGLGAYGEIISFTHCLKNKDIFHWEGVFSLRGELSGKVKD